MKQILVPTDLSKCAENALRTSAGLARMCGATVHLVHVRYPLKSNGVIGVNDKVDARSEFARKAFNERLAQLAQHRDLKGVQVRTHFVSDRPFWRVLEKKPFANMDLVVIGSHGASGAEELFIGSNAQKLVQVADCPVLVVKQYFDLSKVKKIIFASNFHDEAAAAFKPVKEIIDLLGANTLLIKIITPGNFEDTTHSEKMMGKFVKTVGLDDHSAKIINAKSIETGIYEMVDQTKADLICMETHGRTGLAQLFSGSVAENVVNHAKIPVLTVKVEQPKLNSI